MNIEDKKYRKKVNKNGWQCRLYKFVWDKNPTFVGYCPLFWATWFNILILPCSLLEKAIVKGVKFFISFIPEKNKKPIAYETPDACEICILYETWQKIKKVRGDIASCIMSDFNMAISYSTLYWAQDNPDWESYYPKAKEEVDSRLAKAAKRKARLEKRRETMNLISGYTSWMLKPIFCVAAGVAFYKIWRFLIEFVLSLNFWVILKYSGAALLLALSVVVISFILYSIVNFFTSRQSKKEIKPQSDGFIFRLVAGIFHFIEFLVETVKMIYNKECPLVEYCDEDGPIEKK